MAAYGSLQYATQGVAVLAAGLIGVVILLFFYSEEALTSVLTYEHSPGGWTPSVKVTPETRNTGGLGMF